MSNRRKNKLIILGIIMLIIVTLSVGFSAFQKSLYVDDMNFYVRLEEDVRVSNVHVSKTNSSAISNYEEYNVSKLIANVTLPNSSAYVLYKVDLTNYGNVKSGLLNITNNSNVNYSICNSSGNSCSALSETAVCSGSDCTLGATKELYLKVSSNTGGTYDVNLDFEFEPYNSIEYNNVKENISSFRTEIMSNDSYQLTLTSKPEVVEVNGSCTYTYNKNTGVLNISHVDSDLSINAKYLATKIYTDYNTSNPSNYVRFNDELYRMIAKDSVSDGYGNTETRVKIISNSSIGNNAFDSTSNDFASSGIKNILNTTYYDGLSSDAKELIETVAWTNDYTGYVGLIKSSDYTSNSAWFNKYGFTLTQAENDKVVSVTVDGLVDTLPSASLATYPSLYLSKEVLIVDGNGTESSPYLLEIASGSIQTNPTIITGKTQNVTGSNLELVTVSNKVGTVYFSKTTQLDSSNYTSGSTSIPTEKNAGNYTIYYYIPAGENYKAKSGRVTAHINPLTFQITYTKGANVSSIGKQADLCTTTGSSITCSVTLPSITPSAGYRATGWSDGTNTYNIGSSYTLSQNASLTAMATGDTFVATFNANGATYIGETSLQCTVTTGSSCTVIAPSITREGFTISGWGTSSDATSGIQPGNTITLTQSGTYYAVTSKTITITFNKNGNTSQTPNGGTASTDTTIDQSCVIQNNHNACTIKSPTITTEGFTAIGYSNSANDHTSGWNQNTEKSVNSNATYFAQTIKAERTVTITFNKNGNAGQTPNGGTTSTANTITQSCTIDAVYNGGTQASTCNITSPTISTASGYDVVGYSTEATDHTSSWNHNTQKAVGENTTYFAQSQKLQTANFVLVDTNAATLSATTSNCYTYNGASGTCTVTPPTLTAKTGYVVDGWSTTNGGTTTTTTFTSGNTYYSVTHKGYTANFVLVDSNAATLNSNTAACTSYNGETSCTVTPPTLTAKSGYTVDGWSTTNGGTTTTTTFTSGNTYYSVTHSTAALTATFTIQDSNAATKSGGVTSCYKYNGATSCTITAPTLTAKTGYTVVGWNTNQAATTSSLNSGATASISSNTTYYSITYNSTALNATFDLQDSNAATVSGGTTSCYKYNGSSTCKVTSPTLTAKTGYTVIGWNTNGSATTSTLPSNTEVSISADTTYHSITRTTSAITATFTIQDSNAATQSGGSPSCYKYNGALTCEITTPTLTAKTGYTVIGWNYDQNATTASVGSNESILITSNITYYSITRTSSQISATFTIQDTNAATKSGGTTSCYKFNGATSCSITSPTLTANDGYTVIGWNTNGNATESTLNSNTSTTITANTTYYSITRVTAPVTATFTIQDTNAATKTGGLTTCYKFNGATSCSIMAPTLTPKSGYTAVGWNTDGNAQTSTLNSGATTAISSNTTYYSITKYNTALTATFTIQDTNAATANGGVTTCYKFNGSTSCNITAPTLTANSGYTAVGWNTNGNSTESTLNSNASAPITANTTYYSITYNSTQLVATFTIQDSNAATKSGGTTSCYKYNGSSSCNITSPTLTANEGYTAVGWNTSSNATTSSLNSNTSATITASTAYYSITYDSTPLVATFTIQDPDAATMSGGTTNCNKFNGASSCQITAPTLTAKTGYTVVGWNTDPTSNVRSLASGATKSISSNVTYYSITYKNNYQNLSSNEYYEKLVSALALAQANDTIKVLNDVTENIEPSNHSNGIKLDLNGKKITIGDDINFHIEGSLDIYNTSSTTGTIEGGDVYLLYNYGTLTINGTSSNNTVSILGEIYNYGALTINENTQVNVSGTALYNKGTLTINGGTIYGSSFTINGQPGSTVTINDGTLGYVSNSGTLTINGGTFTANNTAVSADGAITINGGTFTANAHCIKAYGSSTTLTIGNNDSTVSTTSPLIQTNGTSSKYGVYVTEETTFNFYDGVIKSASGTGYSIYGDIADMPDNYNINKTTSNGIETAILVEANYQNTTTNSYYSTLNDAFNDVTNNQTIKVLKDYSETTGATLASGKTGIKLDLNGKTLTMNNSDPIINNGELDIYNTSSTAGKIKSNDDAIITNNGTLTLNGTDDTNPINVTYQYDSSSDRVFVIHNTSTGTTSVNANVRIESSLSASIKNEGAFTMNGGVIYSAKPLVNEGTIVLNNGYIQCEITNKNTMTINGGNIGMNVSSIFNGFIKNNSNATLNMNGGVISVSSTSSGDYVVYNNGTFNMTDGTISGTKASGINNYGTASITGGKIYSSNGNCIYITSGSVTLGSDNGTVSKTSPLIEASTTDKYGVYIPSGKTFNFYDGIIKGKASGHSIYGTVTDIPDGYEISKALVSGTESATLIRPNYLNTTTNVYFETLNDAFTSVANNQTIQVINNVTETSNATLASSKTGIQLDLNGKKITLNSSKITNNGSLRIYNTSTTAGTIETGDGNAVANNGTLVTNGVENNNNVVIIKNASSSYSALSTTDSNANTTINANTQLDNTIGTPFGNVGTTTIEGGTLTGVSGIQNHKTLIINGGSISASSGFGITNFDEVTINGGSLYSTSVAINNYGDSTLNINGGTITSSDEEAISNSGTLNITGGTITGTMGVRNYSSATINISGPGLVKGNSSYGIYNLGTIVMTAGTIESVTYAIHNINSVTIGSDDGTVSNTTPIVKTTGTSNSYGLYNISGHTFNFYDGVIQSASGLGYSIYGEVTNTPDGYGVSKSEYGGVETAKLIELIYQNTTTGRYYDKLGVAINSVSNNQTIKVLKDITESSGASLSSSKTGVKLDLNGKSISFTSGNFRNDGELDIYNSSSSTGSMLGMPRIYNYGTLTINGTSDNNPVMIYANDSTSVDILINNYNGSLTIYGNTQLKSANGAGIYNKGNITLVDAIIDVSRIGIDNQADGTVNVTGNSQIHTTESISYGLRNYGVATISGGQISTVQSFTISNYDGTLTITGGNIESANNSAIYTTGTTTITGGTISGMINGVNAGGGTLTIGTNDTIISKTLPSISSSGTHYGVQIENDATFNWYDGIIMSSGGTGKSLNVTPNDIPTGYTIKKTTTDGVESAILFIENYQNTTTNVKYETLNEAFSGVSNGETIQVLRNATESQTATLSNGKTGVKLDLNGKTLTINQGAELDNNGTLDIYNTSSTEGSIVGSDVNTIQNNGTLTLNETSNTNAITIDNVSSDSFAKTIFNNTGSLTIYPNSQINNDNCIGVYNEDNGTVTTAGDINAKYAIVNDGIVNIIGGTVDGSYYGIHNDSGATINMNGIASVEGSTTYGIDNYGTVSMLNGTVTGVTAGIRTAGTANIIGGTVTGVSNGIEILGAATLGSDDVTISKLNPVIQATGTSDAYGVYVNNGGTFNFYDGVIRSASGTSYAIYGTVADTPDATSVVETTSNGIESATLSIQNYENTTTNAKYETLAQAFSEVLNNETIKVLQDVTDTQYPPLAEGKTGIKLDLNGKTISLTSGARITNYGELDIYNSSSAIGTIESDGNDPVASYGVLTINGTSNTNPVIIKNTNTYQMNAIYVGSGSLTTNENTTIVNASGYGISTYTEATVVLNKTDISANIGISNSGTMTISDSTITAASCGVRNNTGGTLTINSGAVISATNASGNGLSNAGTLTINAGTITGGQYGIDNQSTITMNGGSVNGTGSYGIYDNGTITMLGGTVTGYDHGIYILNGKSLTMGVNDSTVSTTTPIVQTTRLSSKYGVYVVSGGTFNFYDGLVKSASGQSRTIYGTVAAIPNGYALKKTLIDDIGVAMLLEGNYFSPSTNDYYAYLDDAFEGAGSGTIKVIKDTVENDAVDMPSLASGFKLDLNGKTVVLNNTEGINVLCPFEIYNSSSTVGTLEGTGPYTLSVVRALTINGTSSTNPVVIKNTNSGSDTRAIYVLYQTSSVTVNPNVQIIGENGRGIQGGTRSSITIVGGTVTAKGNAIETSTGYVDVNPNSQITSTTGYAVKSAGTVTIAGGTLNGVYGLYNNGTATVTAGTIRGTSYGIWSSGENSLLTLGIDDGIVSTNAPFVEATGTSDKYGVFKYNTGDFHFYDGIIKSASGAGKSISGETAWADQYAIQKTVTDGVETAILVNANYKNMTTNLSYLTLSEAFSNVSSGDTIKVLRDVTDSLQANLYTNQVKLDLNGKTITSGYIINNGELDIYNSSSTQGIFEGDNSYSLSNRGILSINGTSNANTTIIRNVASGYDAIVNEYTHTLTINDNSQIYGLYNQGSTTVNGGLVDEVHVTSTGNLNIQGGAITATNNSTDAISNQGIITMTGGTVSGTKYGINNKDTGTVTITGGTVTGVDNGICSINTSTLNLGTNDSTISTTSPIIQTTGTNRKYGVYTVATATFNFYDGVVKSASGTSYSIYGTVANTPTGYSVGKTTTDGVESAILVENKYINTSTNKGYASLVDAFSGVQSNETIQVLRDSTETRQATLAAGKTGVKLDLNGKTISSSSEYISDYAIVNRGELDIYNTSSTPGTIEYGWSYLLNNLGTLTLNRTSSSNNINLRNIANSSATQTINNNSTASITINDNVTIFNDKGTGIYNNGNSTERGTVIINGGTILSSNKVALYNNGLLTINDGIITGYESGIANQPTGIVNIVGGAINSTNENAIMNNGQLTMTGGTLTASVAGIAGAGSSQSTITGGTITGSEYGINIVYYDASVTIGIDDTTVSTTSPVIQATGTNSKNGVKVINGGIFNFYDGVISSDRGTNNAISGTVANTPTGYGISKETTNGVEYATLVLANYQNTTTGAFYGTLKEAFTAVANNQTIKVLEDTTEDEAVTLAATKSGIKLDLNGKTVTYTNVKYITVAGELDVYNTSSSTGTLTSNGSTNLWVTGTATLNGTSATNPIVLNCTRTDGTGLWVLSTATATVNDNVEITSGYSGIANAGSLTINGGTIHGPNVGVTVNSGSTTVMNNGSVSGTAALSPGFNVDENATVTIKSGTITAYKYGIKNRGSVTLGTNDGTVNTSNPVISQTMTDGNGIYNDGTNYVFNFYDGIIHSSAGTGKAIRGTVANWASGYGIIKTTTNGVETAELVEASYQNTTTNRTFAELNVAFSEVQTGETIKILKNATETVGSTLGSGITGVTLDLNGKTITGNVSPVITNNGELDIYNTSSTSGTIEGSLGTVLSNTNVLTLNGTSTTNNITIHNICTSSGTGISNTSTGSVTINNNTTIISDNGTGVSNGHSTSSDGIITLNNGTIIASVGIGISNSGILTINNGSITGYNYGISNNSAGSLTMYNGTVTSQNNRGIYNQGTAVITGGTITGVHFALHTLSSGVTTLGTNDSTISTTSPYIETTGTSSKYGAYINSGATFNFYDGVIKSASGTGYAIYGKVAGTPAGYGVLKTTTDGTETAILAEANYTNTTTGVSFIYLNDAFTDVANGNTIKVLKDVTETTAATIDYYKTGIKLDLNGKTITSSAGYAITNNGELDIYNSSSTLGTLSNSMAGSVRNYKTLTLNGTSSTNGVKLLNTNTGGYGTGIDNYSNGVITINDNSTVIAEEGYGIKNGGTLTINGGSIVSQLSYSAINNRGTLTINNGTITGNKGILSENNSSLIMNSGTITGTGDDGIYLQGSATILGGTVTGAFDGINIYSTGSLTLGENDSTVSTTSPVIESTATSNRTGVYAYVGTFNFYDGVISSASGTGWATNVPAANTPTGYAISKTTTNGVETAILVEVGYQNTTSNATYGTLNDAFADVQNGETIQVTRNVTETSTATLPSGKSGVKLDLNGKTITTSAANGIRNNGGLDIYNSSSTTGTITDNGTNSDNGVFTLSNNGTLTINATDDTNTVMIKNTSPDMVTSSIYNTTAKTLTVNDNVVIDGGDYYAVMGGGTVTINDATITSNNIAVPVSGTYTFNDTTINSQGVALNVASNGIANINGNSQIYGKYGAIENMGTVNISNGTLSSNATDADAPTINNHGALTITGGTITGIDNAIDNNADGTLTLGTNDSTTSNTSPLIVTTGTPSKYGVYNEGTFNFYDGKVESASGTGYGVYGTINNQTSGYQVSRTTVNGEEIVTLIATNYQNTTTNNYYETLSAAFSNVANNQTIKVLNNVTETTVASLASTKSGIKLDLNGKTITFSVDNGITNSGTLDIYNTSSDTGFIEGYGNRTILNAGTLTLNGTSSSNKISIQNLSSSATSIVITNNSSKTVTMNNNTYLLSTSGRGAVNHGTFTMNNKSSIQSDAECVNNQSSGTFSISGNSRLNSFSGNAITQMGTATIAGGIITGNNYGIYTQNGSTTTIGINDSTVSTSNPSIETLATSSRYALYIYSGATVNFYDGVITSYSGTGYAIYGTVNQVAPGYTINYRTIGDYEKATLGT